MVVDGPRLSTMTMVEKKSFFPCWLCFFLSFANLQMIITDLNITITQNYNNKGAMKYIHYLQKGPNLNMTDC